jgi:hypothetical protein
MLILLLILGILVTPFIAQSQGTWMSVELPEDYRPLPRLNTDNPVVTSMTAAASSPNGNIAFFGIHNQKNAGSVWYLENGDWRHLRDFGIGLNGVKISQVLPFPGHTWPPKLNRISLGVYFLDGIKIQGKNHASINYWEGKKLLQFGGKADEEIPFKYLDVDESTGDVFFIGQPTIIVRKPPYNIPQEARGDYGIYRLDKWGGEYNALDPNAEPPVELIVDGTPDELGYQPVGPLYAAGGYLVFWSARGVLPRLERFNYKTGERETLLSLVDKAFGQNVKRIHSAVVDMQGNVYVAFADSLSRIAVFPVKADPAVLFSFETLHSAGWPPSVLLHEVHQGRLLFSHPASSGVRDTLAELSIETGQVRSILNVGDSVVGKVVTSLGQFAGYYSLNRVIVQIDNLGDNFGRLVTGNAEEQIEESDPKPSDPDRKPIPTGIPMRRR